jgi:hypothetical protein
MTAVALSEFRPLRFVHKSNLAAPKWRCLSPSPGYLTQQERIVTVLRQVRDGDHEIPDEFLLNQVNSHYVPPPSVPVSARAAVTVRQAIGDLPPIIRTNWRISV